MKTTKILSQYNLDVDEEAVKKAISEITEKAKALKSQESLKQILSFIDLTTLSERDNTDKAKRFAKNVSEFSAKFPNYSNVAAICVYPELVKDVRENVKVDNFSLASVVGGFPASQTLIEIKQAETEAAINAGATEADMVISVGKFLAEDYDTVFEEINKIKESCGENHLKVILETGALPSLKAIKTASVLGIEAGGDFIKTSTGKIDVSATPEAMYIMAQTVKEYYDRTGKKIGLKPAGGISDADTAMIYYAIVKEVLGSDWLSPEFFRIGASSLANKVLSELEGREVSYF
ncbi:MAG: deoxyribose-phosphate aldolase [Bacteroidota bacterium]|nr:deoxyribose-phosphate aldolase [Bacteroidota bacterium]